MGGGEGYRPIVQATSPPWGRSRNLPSSNSPQHQTLSEPWGQKQLNNLFVVTCFGDTPHWRWWDCSAQTCLPFMSLCGYLTMTSNHKALPQAKAQPQCLRAEGLGCLPICSGSCSLAWVGEAQGGSCVPRWPQAASAQGLIPSQDADAPIPSPSGPGGLISQLSVEDSSFSRVEQWNRYSGG